jgi:hypothetical protein
MFKHRDLIKFFTDARMSLSIRIALAWGQRYLGLSKEDRALPDETVAKAEVSDGHRPAKSPAMIARTGFSFF